MSLFATKNHFEEIGILVGELKNIDRAKSNLVPFHRVNLKLVNALAIEVVIVNLMSGQHEAVKS